MCCKKHFFSYICVCSKFALYFRFEHVGLRYLTQGKRSLVLVMKPRRITRNRRIQSNSGRDDWGCIVLSFFFSFLHSFLYFRFPSIFITDRLSICPLYFVLDYFLGFIWVLILAINRLCSIYLIFLFLFPFLCFSFLSFSWSIVIVILHAVKWNVF